MREQYLKELKEALEHVNPEIEKEIVEDFQAHFEMGLEEGKTEEELAQELGDPKELAKQLEEEYGRFDTPAKAEPEVEDTKHHRHTEHWSDEEWDNDGEPVEFIDSEGKIKAMKLDMVIAEIYVSRSKDGVFRVTYENSASGGIFKKKIRYHSYVSGDTFIAKEETTGNLGRAWSSMEIELPEDFVRIEIAGVSTDVEMDKISAKESITINLVSGNVELSDLLTEELRFDTTSGDVEGSRVKAQIVRMDTVSGDISFEKLYCKDFSTDTTSGDVELVKTVCDTIHCETVSGDISVEELEGENVEMHTTSGDVELILGGETGYTVSVETMSGDVDMDFGHSVSKGFADKKYRGVLGDGASRIFVKTLSGDVTVEQ